MSIYRRIKAIMRPNKPIVPVKLGIVEYDASLFITVLAVSFVLLVVWIVVRFGVNTTVVAAATLAYEVLRLVVGLVADVEVLVSLVVVAVAALAKADMVAILSKLLTAVAGNVETFSAKAAFGSAVPPTLYVEVT